MKNEMTIKDAAEFFKEGKSSLLYFGFDDCPWCKEALPILELVLKENNLPFNYVKIRDENRNPLFTKAEKDELIPYIRDYVEENDEGELTIYVPLVVAVKNGKTIDGHVGTVEDHDAHERLMNEQEVMVLSDIYNALAGIYKDTFKEQ